MPDHNDPEAINYDRLVAQETLLFEAAERLAELLNDASISRTELARRLGKSKGFVTQVLAGDRNMTLRTLADLGYVLGHSFVIVAKPGKLPVTDGGEDPKVSSTRMVLAHGAHDCPTAGRRRPGGLSNQALAQLDFRRLRVGGAPTQPPPLVYTKVSA